MVFQWFQIDGKKINNARYADDTTIIASTDEFVRKYFEDSVNESDAFNMKINSKKTKAMVISRGGQTSAYQIR